MNNLEATKSWYPHTFVGGGGGGGGGVESALPPHENYYQK